MGDHWEAKDEKGPSDEQAARGGAGGGQQYESHGGVDAKGHTKDELLDQARERDIAGRSSMSKDELADALDRDNQKQTRRARERERD